MKIIDNIQIDTQNLVYEENGKEHVVATNEQVNELKESIGRNVDGIARLGTDKQDKLSQTDLDNIAMLNQLQDKLDAKANQSEVTQLATAVETNATKISKKLTGKINSLADIINNPIEIPIVSTIIINGNLSRINIQRTGQPEDKFFGNASIIISRYYSVISVTEFKKDNTIKQTELEAKDSNKISCIESDYAYGSITTIG